MNGRHQQPHKNNKKYEEVFQQYSETENAYSCSLGWPFHHHFFRSQQKRERDTAPSGKKASSAHPFCHFVSVPLINTTSSIPLAPKTNSGIIGGISLSSAVHTTGNHESCCTQYSQTKNNPHQNGIPPFPSPKSRSPLDYAITC